MCAVPLALHIASSSLVSLDNTVCIGLGVCCSIELVELVVVFGGLRCGCANYILTSVIIFVTVLFALADKECRSRILFHDVPESEVLDVLSNFGVSKETLPTFMGGNLEFDQSEWIANRRAAELEEI
jgi:hypothetical protein